MLDDHDAQGGASDQAEAEKRAKLAEIKLRILEIAEMDSVDADAALNDLAAKAKPLGITKKALIKQLEDARKVKTDKAAAAAKSDIEKAIAKVNARYYVVRQKTKARIGELVKKELGGHTYHDLHLYSKEDFRLLEANDRIAGRSAGEWWLESENRREATGTTLDPKHPFGAVVRGKVNLWQGFAVEPKRGDVTWFLQHVYHLLGGRADYADYFVRWCAWGFQHPGLPIGTAIALIGDPGAGKGLIGNFLRELWGPHGIVIEDREGLLGKFNGHLRDKGFGFLDEPPFAGSKADADKMKHIITDPTRGNEGKFLDREEIDNMLKLLIVTNHAWAAQVDPGDRRYAVFQASEKMIGDDVYFARFAALAADPDARAAVLYMMLKLDLTGFHPERDRPQTDAYTGQKAASLAQDFLFWRQVTERATWKVAKGGLLKHDGIETLKPDVILKISQTAIYNCYCEWHDTTNGRGAPVTKEWFWRNFNQWAKVTKTRDPYGAENRDQHVHLPDFATLARQLEDWLRNGGRGRNAAFGTPDRKGERDDSNDDVPF